MKFGHKWEMWELKLIGFALPWWFGWGPTLARAAWRWQRGGELPREVSDALHISYAMLFFGVMLALVLGSSDVAAIKGWEKPRTVAAAFMVGLITLPLGLFFS